MKSLRAAIVAGLALLLVACVPTSPSPPPPPAGDLHVSPTGGGDCSDDAPCTLVVALGRAGSGTRVLLESGDYGSVELPAMGHLADLRANVEISPVDPAEAPTFERLEVSAAHLSWTGVRVTRVWYLNPGADHAVLDAVHLEGGGLFVRARDAVVRGSTFEGGSSLDGIQIGQAAGVLIEGNVIRDYDQSGDSGRHADCIQVFDSSDVVIRGNRIGNCYNAGIIISGGAEDGIDGLLIEANFVQGCVVKDETCRGGSAADLRDPLATGVVVRNNSFTHGSVRVGPDVVFDRNLVGYLSDCTSPVTNSVIELWNTGLCAEPDAAGRDGNRLGTVSYVDRDAGDLRLADPETARITPSGDAAPADASIDGVALPADIAGAWTP